MQRVLSNKKISVISQKLFKWNWWFLRKICNHFSNTVSQGKYLTAYGLHRDHPPGWELKAIIAQNRVLEIFCARFTGNLFIIRFIFSNTIYHVSFFLFKAHRS